MKFPSLHHLFTNAKESLFRFPLVIASAFLVFFTSFLMIDGNHEKEQVLANALIVFATGVPLFFSIKVFSEHYQSRLHELIGYGLGILILGGFYYSLPTDDSSTIFPYVRFALFNIFVHLLISIAPFLNQGNQNGFWQYNKMLFIRLFLSILYSGVLYIGLAICLLTLRGLFDIKVDEKVYFYLFTFLASVVNIWIFMAGVDEDIQGLEESDDYPTALKVFAQYIMLGLIILYFIILYTYVVTIIIRGEWPKGVLSYLIIGVSILGYLTVLLLHPYTQKQNSSWFGNLGRAFNFLVLPLVIVLFFAVGIRVSDYGITMNRYFIILLGVWLTYISITRIIKPDWLKVVPSSIAVFVLLSSFGPWGVESVSRRSQVNRLEAILIKNNALKEGKLVQEYSCDQSYDTKLLKGKKEIKFPENDAKEISSIINYLGKHHGFEDISPWFSQSIAQDTIDVSDNYKYLSSRNQQTRKILKMIGVQYNQYGYAEETINYRNYRFYLENRHQVMIPVSGYDFITQKTYSSSKKELVFDNETYTSKLTKTHWELEKRDNLIKEIPLDSLMKNLIEKYESVGKEEIPEKDLTLETEDENYQFKLVFSQIRIEHTEGESLKHDYGYYRLYIKQK